MEMNRKIKIILSHFEVGLMVQVMACKFIFAYFVIIATKICNSSCYMKFVCVLSTPIGIRITIYCDAILCSQPKIYQHFRAHCLDLPSMPPCLNYENEGSLFL